MRRSQYYLSYGFSFIFCFFGLSSQTLAQSSQVFAVKDAEVQGKLKYSCFVASQPIRAWGSIVGTKDAAVNLTEKEVVYILIEPSKDLKVGDRYLVLRKGVEVIHPVTKRRFGNLVGVLGEVTILSTQDEMARARIDRSLRTIMIGDLIVPTPQISPESGQIRPMKKIEAMIILTAEGTENITEMEYIILDRGLQDGVIVGDRFFVYQQGFVVNEKFRAPSEKVGEIFIVSVQENTSTALVMKSSQAIYIGDRAVSGGE
jgi:hypothetical protein